MKRRTKILIGSCAVAVAIIGCGAFAIFSDSSTEGTSSTAGSVEVDISNVDIENIENFNPGDNDPTLDWDPNDPRNPGTEHNIDFSVTNVGTKSIRTKHEITITMDDGTDPSVFYLYTMEKVLDEDGNPVLDEDGNPVYVTDENGRIVYTEAYDKYYEISGTFSLGGQETPLTDEDGEIVYDDDGNIVMQTVGGDGEEVTFDKEYVSSEVYDELKAEYGDEVICTAIRYIIASDIMDGSGPEGTAEVEEVSTVRQNEEGIVTKDYTYSLAMSQYATDEYQGKTFTIDVCVYTMQYRNNSATGWYLSSSSSTSGFLN